MKTVAPLLAYLLITLPVSAWAEERPNILFCISDDQSYAQGSAGKGRTARARVLAGVSAAAAGTAETSSRAIRCRHAAARCSCR